ncbi:MAG: hypothetical protein BWK80_20320 [Desulfobacteraceae bacterium IS3]|nr:MAG: hypothetical protein BWK80_20320 [Desulfobacteraceae bacterium IS3]
MTITKTNILVVDDIPANLRLLAEILANREYMVRPVPDGARALAAAKGAPPDLILLDIMMPNMSGYEVCEQLKSDERTRDIPVIFISAQNEIMDKVKAFSLGAVDYITKPFQAEEVLARVETHLTLRNLQKRLEEEKAAAENAREIAEATTKKIMESIRYARRIQNSLLPNMAHLREYLPESFLLWMPRDIVGGDMFVAEFRENSFLIALIDCTGHGVPGAMMTMLATSAFNRILRDEDTHDPALILQRLNTIIKETLQQDTEHATSDDGLDAGVCLVNPKERLLTFAGARLPLYAAHNSDMTVISGDKQSIGYKRSDINFRFGEHQIEILPGMRFYLTSDGFADQSGGEKNFPFGTRRFADLLKEHAELPFEQQKEALLRAFNDYKGSHQQRDDVTVAGFEISV